MRTIITAETLRRDKPRQCHIVDLIVERLCARHNIPRSWLMSRRRTQHLAFTRHLAIYLARQMAGLSFPAIGALFGQDHSSCIHAHKMIVSRCLAETAFAQQMSKDRAEVFSLLAQESGPPSDEYAVWHANGRLE